MPKVSKESATQGGEFGPVTDRSDEIEGYSVNFASFHEDIDATPLMKGLPDDRCQCPHWGYVISGRVTFRYADGEEVFEAGDAFYTPPGHIPVKHEPGSEAEYQKLMESILAVQPNNLRVLAERLKVAQQRGDKEAVHARRSGHQQRIAEVQFRVRADNAVGMRRLGCPGNA